MMQDREETEEIQDTSSHPLVKARVRAVWRLSPSVKAFRLLVEPPFSFRAGQWVDAVIPGVPVAGGYSLVSPPHELPLVTLAVRASQWPPTRWFYEQCGVGDELQVRPGGDFYLDTRQGATAQRRILLVGGGVGVNPLLSMAAHCTALPRPHRPRLCLLYSARLPQDLLFRDTLQTLATQEGVTVRCLCTDPEADPTPGVTKGRITAEVLRSAADCLLAADDDTGGGNSPKDYSSIEAFVCGPPGMIEFAEQCLVRCGVGSVVYEKWW